MPTFEVTLPCHECDGYGKLYRRASETLEIPRPCPECCGEGQQVFREWGYETEEEVREDHPDAQKIVEMTNENAHHGN